MADNIKVTNSRLTTSEFINLILNNIAVSGCIYFTYGDTKSCVIGSKEYTIYQGIYTINKDKTPCCHSIGITNQPSIADTNTLT